LHILHHIDASLAGAKLVAPDIGHRHQTKAAEGVIGIETHPGVAIGIQHHAGLPAKQGVQQFAGGCLAATATRRQGLAAKVTLAHHLLLRSGNFHP
jgi:hypothetical protein